MNEINISRIDLNLLVVFDAVFKARSVTNAAGVLNLTPSAVSHGLNRLRLLMDDPLFARVPKGVVPTEMAIRIAPDVRQFLSDAEFIFSRRRRFDPRTSSREFVIGVTDAIASVIMPRLLNYLMQYAPDVRLNIRPLQYDTLEAQLDQREMDIALSHEAPNATRFETIGLYQERFSVITRRDHPFATERTLTAYCSHSHVLVSPKGDAIGFVDSELERLGKSRRISAVVPNFFLALAILRSTDLIATLPDTLAAEYVDDLGLVRVPAPLPLQEFSIQAVVPKIMLADEAVKWLVGSINSVAREVAITEAPTGLGRASV